MKKFMKSILAITLVIILGACGGGGGNGSDDDPDSNLIVGDWRIESYSLNGCYTTCPGEDSCTGESNNTVSCSAETWLFNSDKTFKNYYTDNAGNTGSIEGIYSFNNGLLTISIQGVDISAECVLLNNSLIMTLVNGDGIQVGTYKKNTDNYNYYEDRDKDGYGDINGNPIDLPGVFTPPIGYTYSNNDCDDANVNINPIAEEICDGLIDENCDGIIDEDCIVISYFEDADGDGYGDPGASLDSTVQPIGYVLANTDCDDSDANINPGEGEICGDGIDQDCDGNVDAACSSTLFYEDRDRDGYGDFSGDLIELPGVLPPIGYAFSNNDCNDANANINPGAAEICDGLIDENCSGIVDEDCIVTSYYEDTDRDGYGDPNVSFDSTAQPAGYVIDNTDCDDTNASINISEIEICGDGVDQDCDGTIDEYCSLSETKILPSDGSLRDNFGYSVSISGDYAIVGVKPIFKDGLGAAYIYQRSGNDWTQVEKLTPSDAAIDDSFGRSVSISGDYAIVGALGSIVNDTETGAAYIFQRFGSDWTQVDKLTASDGRPGDGLGRSVSISEDYAIVGAQGTRSAYIFQRSGNDWMQVDKLTPPDLGGIAFGWSVSISGDYAIVGAFGYDVGVEPQVGAAYVFQRSGSEWTQVEKLTALDWARQDSFGISVSISGDYAIVGAHGDDDDNGINSGSAYMFQRSGSDWIQVQKLTASDATAHEYFGNSVSISGDMAIVGAFCDGDLVDGPGSAYTFQRSGSDWIQVEKLTASDGEYQDAFGYSVSISGDHAIVGAYEDDDNGDSSGSAYIYNF